MEKSDEKVVVNVNIDNGSGEFAKGVKRNLVRAHRRLRDNLLAIILSVVFLPLGYLVQGRYGWGVACFFLLMVCWAFVTLMVPFVWIICLLDIAFWNSHHGVERG